MQLRGQALALALDGPVTEGQYLRHEYSYASDMYDVRAPAAHFSSCVQLV